MYFLSLIKKNALRTPKLKKDTGKNILKNAFLTIFFVVQSATKVMTLASIRITWKQGSCLL